MESRSQESEDHLENPPSKEEVKDVCSICDFRANSNRQLSSHMNKHKENGQQNNCKVCQEEFGTKVDLEMHFKKKHSKQWNCNDCDFQTSTRENLMNHCKIKAGHKPARGQMSKSGVWECFTCKSELRSYYDLMEHRKEEHLSHKKMQILS